MEDERIRLSGWVQQVGQVKHGAFDPLNNTSCDLSVWASTLASMGPVLVISSGDAEIAVLGSIAVAELAELLTKYVRKD